MNYFFLILFGALAAFYAFKYFRQKVAIRLLSESLSSRTSILRNSEEFENQNKNWKLLVGELNTLIAKISDLDRQNSGRLNQIETTLGNLQEGVLIIDRDNYILLANKFIAGMFPSSGSIIGKRVESCLSSARFLEFLQEVRLSQGELRREISFKVGGKALWMKVSAAELTEVGEGTGPWFLFVLHDITRLKQLEQVRKDFVSNASHELKTPVSVIKGYAETLITDHARMSDSARERFLETIYRHSERLALLINDLLNLSRLEDESGTLRLSHADIIDWLRDVGRDYQFSLGEQGRRFRVLLPSGVKGTTRFDVLKLRQVLDNLVENAHKYSPSEVEIELGASVDESDVVVWVRDYGPGVPERDLKRIFERFYRVDKGRSRDTGGTGLGLSIVKHIVEAHRGELRSENADGGGLKVSFSLALAEVLVVN